MSPNRRKILQASLVASMALAGYTFNRGLRLPTLHWGPLDLDQHIKVANMGKLSLSNLIKTGSREDYQTDSQTNSAAATRLRAYAPEPSLSIEFNHGDEFVIKVGNVASDAILKISPANAHIEETQSGITRTLVVSASAGEKVELTWELPPLAGYKFASIGDTGGDQELAWCIQRAHALGARFLLHLGDFNYQAGDYQRAIDLFNNSPIPVYVSIGNHDFHDSGAIYGDFLSEIGPFNHHFAIGRTRFANIDTAANILPFGAGQRGAMLKRLAVDKNSSTDSVTDYATTVAFTHRPLHDPMEDSHHDLGSDGERDWLIRHLKLAEATTLISGHIHIFDRRDFDGIDNIIVGQGLGHQDLLVGDISYSKMAIGSVSEQGEVRYEFAPLSMPMELHCHPRSDSVKDSLKNSERVELIQGINAQCKADSPPS